MMHIICSRTISNLETVSTLTSAPTATVIESSDEIAGPPELPPEPTSVSDHSDEAIIPSQTPLRPPRRPSSHAPSSQHQKLRKRKLSDESTTGFEAELLTKMDSFISARKSSNAESRFGEEIAEQLSLIPNDFHRETVKREIRDLIFNSRFGGGNQASQANQQNTQLM